MVGKPFELPADPPFPKERVVRSKPFQVTGVDLTGAISVKKNNSIVICYIVLFTCFATRALHLEVIYSLSEEEFLRSFVRFTSRRSVPSIMWSDHGTNFKSAAKTLSEFAKSAKFSNYLQNNFVEWRFIPPRSPWQGGLWERLIGMTKVCIKKVVGKAFWIRLSSKLW